MGTNEDVALADGIERVLTEHQAVPASSPHCLCGWRPTMFFNDTHADRGQHRTHQSNEIVAYLSGVDR